MTPIEFHYAIKDFNEQIKYNQRFELDKMRIQTFYLLNIQLSREDKYNSPKEMMPFEWDNIEPKIILELDDNDWLELNAKYTKCHLN